METKVISLDERVRGEFIAWLMQQDPQEKFYWKYSATCACGRFLHERLPFEQPRWEYRSSVWRQFNDLAYVGEQTYGALLARVKGE